MTPAPKRSYRLARTHRALSPTGKRPHDGTPADGPPSTPKRAPPTTSHRNSSHETPQNEDDRYMDASETEPEVSALTPPPLAPGRPPPIYIGSTWDESYFAKKDQYSAGLGNPFQCKMMRNGKGLVLKCLSHNDHKKLLAKLRQHEEPFTTRPLADERTARYVICLRRGRRSPRRQRTLLLPAELLS